MSASRDEAVAQYFEERSAWWDRIYREPSLDARILLHRQQVALCWVDALGLPGGHGSWRSAAVRVAPRWSWPDAATWSSRSTAARP